MLSSRVLAVSGLALLSLVLIAAAPKSAPAPAKPAAPAQTEPMWNLGDLYASPEAWTAGHDKIKAEMDTIDALKGTLGKSAKEMLAGLDAMSHIKKEVERLNVYAALKGDEDVRIAANQERVQSATALGTLMGEKEAWVTPEIIAIGVDKVKKFENENADLARRYGFFLDNTLRSAPHTLSEEGENVIAATGDILNQPDNIFSVLSNGELPFPSITLSDGTKIARLDQAAYAKYRQSPVRADRKKVFDTFWATFKKYEGTFGATLTTQ